MLFWNGEKKRQINYYIFKYFHTFFSLNVLLNLLYQTEILLIHSQSHINLFYNSEHIKNTHYKWESPKLIHVYMHSCIKVGCHPCITIKSLELFANCLDTIVLHLVYFKIYFLRHMKLVTCNISSLALYLRTMYVIFQPVYHMQINCVLSTKYFSCNSRKSDTRQVL